MSHYRAYILDSGNLIRSAADYEFENDAYAIGSVTGLYPREILELWSGTRRVAKIVAGVVIPAGSPSDDVAGEARHSVARGRPSGS
jgi:hypothetical protein